MTCGKRFFPSDPFHVVCPHVVWADHGGDHLETEDGSAADARIHRHLGITAATLSCGKTNNIPKRRWRLCSLVWVTAVYPFSKPFEVGLCDGQFVAPPGFVFPSPELANTYLTLPHEAALQMALNAALITLAHLRQDAPPRELRMTTHHTSCSMCTDPFFRLGGQQVKPDEDTVPRTWQPSTTRWLNNGCHARRPGIPRNHSSFDSQPI